MLFLLAVQVAVANADPHQAIEYFDCVKGQALRLSRSSESAEAVARVAVFSCESELNPAARAIDALSNAELKARGFSGSSEIGSADRLAGQLSKKAEEMALTIVVEERFKVGKK